MTKEKLIKEFSRLCANPFDANHLDHKKLLSDLDELLRETAEKAFEEGYKFVPSYWGAKSNFDIYWKEVTSPNTGDKK